MNYENVFKKEEPKQVKLILDFLTEEQVFGNKRLKIFEKYGTECAITDFAILLGGCLSNYHTSEGEDLKDRTGWWWLQTPYNNDARVVNNDGSRN